jgi:ATP-binding cassette, subfamily B, heavy metal transporter
MDGQDIRELTQQSLRAAIGIVPQDTVLFNDTIYYNLAYGQARRHATRRSNARPRPTSTTSSRPCPGLRHGGGGARPQAVRRREAAHRHRPRHPQGAAHPGVRRGHLESLDSTEQAIQETLREVAQHHTTLVIAHRLSTVVDADRILVMEQGRIVEQGTHRELLAEGGQYAEMWRLQQEARRQGEEP